MKLIIFIILFSLVFSISSNNINDRKLTLKDLSDPNSPSYVPCPYPKNEEQIEKNLCYVLNLFYKDNKSSSFTSKRNTYNLELATKYLSKTGEFKKGAILKIINKSKRLDEKYFFLIPILNKDNKEVNRIVMADTGLYMAEVTATKGLFLSKCLSDKEISEIKTSTKGLAKHSLKFKRVFYNMQEFYESPMLEAISKDNVRFFIKNPDRHSKRARVYKVVKKEKWGTKSIQRYKKAKNSKSNQTLVVDSLNNELLDLEEIN